MDVAHLYMGRACNRAAQNIGRILMMKRARGIAPGDLVETDTGHEVVTEVRRLNGADGRQMHLIGGPSLKTAAAIEIVTTAGRYVLHPSHAVACKDTR